MKVRKIAYFLKNKYKKTAFSLTEHRRFASYTLSRSRIVSSTNNEVFECLGLIFYTAFSDLIRLM